MDKLQQLYNLMIDRELLTSDISLQQFRDADESQQDALYALALDNNIITSNVVSPEDWKGAWLESAERMAEFNQELELTRMLLSYSVKKKKELLQKMSLVQRLFLKPQLV
jgi:hypothetical protein